MHHEISMFNQVSGRFSFFSLYEREVWYYKKANNDLIQRAMCEFNCEKAFGNKNINEKLSIINTINNVLSNLTSNEIITCDDRNSLWFNDEIENLPKRKLFFTNFILLATKILVNSKPLNPFN